MLRTKTLLLTVAVVALAVPSLWAQKEDGRPSLNEIRQSLPPGVCTVVGGGASPSGYYKETNKCSSGNANYTAVNGDNSKQGSVGACSDSGGVQATYDQGLFVNALHGAGGTWPVTWQNVFSADSTENSHPNIYEQTISISNGIGLTLRNKQSVFGLEVDNITAQTYTVTFHTTGGDVKSSAILVGGSFEPDPLAQRFVGICSSPAITGADVHCDSCTELSGDGNTAIGQLRGDKFRGF